MDARAGARLSRLSSLAPRRIEEPSSSLYCWGLGLIILGLVGLAIYMYTAIISKLFPPSGHTFLATISNDWYYCLLVPLSIPVTIITVYGHWLSMKLFKHA